MTSIEQLFQQNGLPVPPIPPEFHKRLRKLADWLYGSEDAAEISLYDQEAFTPRATDPHVKPALFIGHDGHGTNNWALHYYLFQTDLALLLQMPIGGVYQNEQKCIDNICSTFDTLSELLAEFADARHARRLPAARLFVLQSHINPSWKQWISQSASAAVSPDLDPPPDAEEWSFDGSPLKNALADVCALKAKS